MNKPLKTLLSIIFTAFIIILAAWLPKALFGEAADNTNEPKAMDKESPVGIMRTEYLARALMTSEKFLYEDYAEVDTEQRIKAMKTLYDFLLKTEAPDFLYTEMEQFTDSAVVESLSINTKGGAKLPVIHIYYEWQVNWSNWFEVYLDGESGKILYLYASGSCINSVLTEKQPQVPSLNLIAAVFAEHTGYTQLNSYASDNPNENAVTILYSDGTEEEEYKINCIYYPGTMYDLKIAPLP